MKHRKLFAFILLFLTLAPLVYAGRRKLLSEDFNKLNTGSIPVDWVIDYPDSGDQIGVTEDYVLSGKKSLKVYEDGDYPSCRILSKELLAH